MKQAPWLLAEIGELTAGATVVLDGAESRHAKGPLRLAPGKDVVLTDGAGRVAEGTLSLLLRGRAEVDIHSVVEELPRTGGVTLGMGVLAGTAMDLVVQKAVELGVRRLVPVCCQRSQLGLRRATTRLDHWTRLARQALKQCRRSWALEVSAPLSLLDFMDLTGSVGGVVADPDGGCLDDLEGDQGRTLLVGPEGGFSTDESGILKARGWGQLHLGPHVLRAETAAIAGVAVLATRLQNENEVHSSDGCTRPLD